MRQRRTLLLIVSLLAVIVSLLLLTNPWNTLGKESRKVALQDPEAVDRIVLVDAYDSTELVRIDGKWLLFGEESCNQVPVDNLLVAASRLQIKSMINMKEEDALGAETGEARKIAFFKGTKPLLSFDFLSHSGSYLVRPSLSEKAYYVSVSGYPDLKLNKVFSSASMHYRKHLLIDLLPSEISSIGIQLSSGENFGFHQDSLGNIKLETDSAIALLPEQIRHELAIRLLFSYFTSIRFEKKAGIAADSLSAPGFISGPMATLHVSSFEGEEHLLKVFPYRESPGENAHLFQALVIYNQEPEALLVNYIYLDVLMRGLSHYLGEK